MLDKGLLAQNRRSYQNAKTLENIYIYIYIYVQYIYIFLAGKFLNEEVVKDMRKSIQEWTK